MHALETSPSCASRQFLAVSSANPIATSCSSDDVMGIDDEGFGKVCKESVVAEPLMETPWYTNTDLFVKYSTSYDMIV